MKRFLIILICIIGLQTRAEEYAPFATSGTAPVATMQSVNNSGYVSSGSAYSTTVYAVGASSPSRGPRKAPPTVNPGTPTDDEFNNPNYGPVGDALIPLLLMVMAYATFVLLRRRKSRS